MKPLRQCTFCQLNTENEEDTTELDIAPTMEWITHKGLRYHRGKDMRAIRENGEEGGIYIVDGYTERLARKKGLVE
jgi:hypothetical protein